MYHYALWWLTVALLFVLFEMGHPGLFFFLSFAGGACVASFASFLMTSATSQLVMFLVGTILSMYGLKRWVDCTVKGQKNTNTAALLGKCVIVLTDISPGSPGTVTFDGTVWTAYTHKEAFAKGDRVMIHAVSGAHVVVRPVVKSTY